MGSDSLELQLGGEDTSTDGDGAQASNDVFYLGKFRHFSNTDLN
jgi:hypothetical protein